jgi:UDP-glucose 4-epimerase
MVEGKSLRSKLNSYGEITRVKRDLGYKPRYRTETAIAEYIVWLWAGNLK